VSARSANSDDRPPRSAIPVWRWLFGLASFFTALVAYLSYDEVRMPSSVPLKSTSVATVPLFNAWTIGWNADRAANGFRNYWDAPIFFPAERSFAFSEPQPATILVAPVCWATGSAIAGYKAWLFLSLALNGFFTAMLLRRIGHGEFIQVVCGTAICLLPIIHQQIDVLQLVPVWGILWFWSSVFGLDRNPGWRASVETGFSFAMCFALSVHHGLFLSMVMPFAVIMFARRLADRAFLTASLSSIFVAAVLVLPIVLPIHSAASANNFVRSEDAVKRQSARLEQYVATPPNALIHFGESSSHRAFNVGWFRIGAAVLGIATAFIPGPRRRWVVFLIATGAAAFSFSFGGNIELFGWKPWLSLSEVLPGLEQVRNVFRFVWLVQMAIVLLAAEGLAAVMTVCQRRVSGVWLKPSMAIFVVIPGVLLAAEIWPETAQRGGTPDVTRHAGWTEFLRENREAWRPVACLPFASGNSINDFDVTARWMIHSLEHGAPMLNGYSGFFPKPYLELRNFVNAEFPSNDVVSRFAELDVEYLIVARKYCAPEELLAAVPDKLDLIFEDEEADVDVYRITSCQ